MSEKPLNDKEIRAVRQMIAAYESRKKAFLRQAEIEEELSQIPTSGDGYGSG
jgi:hypothetical protein